MWKTSNTDIDKKLVNPEEKTTISKGKQNHQATKQIKSTINKLKKEEQSLLIRLEELETLHNDIENKMAEPSNYSDGKKIRSLKQELDQNELLQEETSTRWEEVELKLDGLS